MVKPEVEGCVLGPLVLETVGGESYEYRCLTDHIVAAAGVCGGRPTVKYTRLDARWLYYALREGEEPETLIARYQGEVSEQALSEVRSLAQRYGADLFETSLISPGTPQ